MAVTEFLSSTETQLYLLMISLLFGGLMMYIGQAEQILQKDIYQLNHLFPFAFATIVLGMSAASVTNAKVVMRVGLHSILRAGLAIVVISDIVFLLTTLSGDGIIPLWLFLLLFITHFFGFGLTMPNLNTLALAPYHHIAGTASALIGMITSVVGVGLAQVFSHFYDATLYSIASGFIFCVTILLIAYTLLLKIPTKKS